MFTASSGVRTKASDEKRERKKCGNFCLGSFFFGYLVFFFCFVLYSFGMFLDSFGVLGSFL